MFIFGKSSLDLVEPDWFFLIQLHELAKELCVVACWGVVCVCVRPRGIKLRSMAVMRPNLLIRARRAALIKAYRPRPVNEREEEFTEFWGGPPRSF